MDWEDDGRLRVGGGGLRVGGGGLGRVDEWASAWMSG